MTMSKKTLCTVTVYVRYTVPSDVAALSPLLFDTERTLSELGFKVFRVFDSAFFAEGRFGERFNVVAHGLTLGGTVGPVRGRFSSVTVRATLEGRGVAIYCGGTVGTSFVRRRHPVVAAAIFAHAAGLVVRAEPKVGAGCRHRGAFVRVLFQRDTHDGQGHDKNQQRHYEHRPFEGLHIWFKRGCYFFSRRIPDNYFIARVHR